MTKRYKIANKVVEINSIYSDVHTYCKDYISNEKQDYTITINQNDINFERYKSEQEDIKEGIKIRKFSDEYLEELAAYRKIADKMVEYDTILFHGSVIAVDGEAYLFTAKSGTGKSTHTKLWKEYFGKRAIMVNDDKPLIHIGNDCTVYGTPYNGKHGIGSNISVPLKAICILERSQTNKIVPTTTTEAYKIFLQQVYRPLDIEKLKKVIDLVDNLLEKVKIYKLGCNISTQAVEVAYRGMNII